MRRKMFSRLLNYLDGLFGIYYTYIKYMTHVLWIIIRQNPQETLMAKHAQQHIKIKTWS